MLQLMPLLFIGEFFSDFTLVLKIFVFLTIVSFVKNHVGNNVIAIVITILFSWYALFVAFAFFGTIYLLYTLLLLGVSGIVIDFFFVSQSAGHQNLQDNSPVSSGYDIVKRQVASRQAMMRR